ncbi:transposase [Allocoleopsis sp.]|uniref:RNA-guided endonuclease InsQ/TnpB family protein n=1 Tax=Allocoleopsis sp. TaxID=3088169 RepID=UPI0032C2322B
MRTSSPFFTASVQGFTDSANTRLRCRKIRIYPSVELNRIWRKWLAACRYCFNQAIAYQRQNKRIGKLKLRNIIMQSDLPKWVKETPCHIRQNAIFDAARAYTASTEAKFRSCRDLQQTIKFNERNFSSGCWYPKLTKELGFTVSEALPKTCSNATQLTFSKGRWFAIIPEEMIIERKNKDGVIALDPGVRTFLTGFDGSRFIEFGQGDIGRITRLCQHLDNLISQMSKACRKQRRRMRQASHRIRAKIKDLIDEAHKQIVRYLTDNYRVIFLPTFETSQMVAKARRKIRSKTVRSMLTWAHYRFELFLAQKAEMTNTIVITGSEAYTSKTCTKCGHIHRSLGGSKVFKCPSCGHTLPRDMNGALGFMLRALRDTAFTVSNDGVAIAALSGDFPYCVA